jgi:hypothetical protein
MLVFLSEWIGTLRTDLTIEAWLEEFAGRRGWLWFSLT